MLSRKFLHLTVGAASLISACAPVRYVDAALYGAPPPPLQADVTVMVEFENPAKTSTSCGRRAFGPLGAIVPVHGCVFAVDGDITMSKATFSPLAGEKRIVEYVEPSILASYCDEVGGSPLMEAFWPKGSCTYHYSVDLKDRLVFPNPCKTGDLYGCHELGHVNQFLKGWRSASMTPKRHWGIAPKQETMILFAGGDEDATFEATASPVGIRAATRPVAPTVETLNNPDRIDNLFAGATTHVAFDGGELRVTARRADVDDSIASERIRAERQSRLMISKDA